jgi:hypothetical protein
MPLAFISALDADACPILSALAVAASGVPDNLAKADSATDRLASSDGLIFECWFSERGGTEAAEMVWG